VARLRAALDDDLDAPGARTALDDLATALLDDRGGASASNDQRAPQVLADLAKLCGIDLDRPL
jgi:hypothetical protein